MTASISSWSSYIISSNCDSNSLRHHLKFELASTTWIATWQCQFNSSPSFTTSYQILPPLLRFCINRRALRIKSQSRMEFHRKNIYIGGFKEWQHLEVTSTIRYKHMLQTISTQISDRISLKRVNNSLKSDNILRLHLQLEASISFRQI